MNLIFTGMGEMLGQQMAKNGSEHWAIQAFSKVNYIDACPIKSSVYNTDISAAEAAAPETIKIDKSKLVYLTADSPNNI